MATIAELVLKLRGDNTELRQTLEDSAQRAVAFTQTIQDAMARSQNSARSSGLGALAAQQFLESMQSTLESETRRIKEAQYNMLLTPAEAAEKAGEAALAYNNSILITISNLRASGNLTSVIERQLIDALSKSGLQAGIALQEAVATGIKEGQPAATAAAEQAASGTFTAYSAQAEKSMARTNTALTNAGGNFTTFGRRGATALVGLGFGIESFANGTESGMRRALRSVETFALFMGPEGLVVAAILTAGLAIYDHFHKIEKQIDDLLKHAMEAASTAANSMDQLGLEKILRDIQFGQPTSVDQKTGELIVNARSQFAENAFAGSAADLQAHIEAINNQILEVNKTGNVLLAGKLKTQADDLQKLLDPLAKRYNEIQDLILNPAPQAPFVTGNKAIEVKGLSPDAQAAKATKEYYESLQQLVLRLDAARSAGRGYADILEQILNAYAHLGGMEAILSGKALPGEKLEDTQKRLEMIKELYKTVADIGAKVSVTVPDPLKDFDKTLSQNVLKTQATPGPMSEQIENFNKLIASIEEYRQNIELTNLDLQAHGQHIIDINEALKPLRDQAVGMAEDLRKALRAAGLDPAITDVFVQNWLEALKKIGAGTDETTSKLQRMADILGKIGDSLNAAAGLNTALRGQQNVSNVLSSAGQAAGSIGTAVASGGTDVGADIQALTDVINVGNALTASAREIALEHKEILKENNLRLAEVSMRLQGFVVSAATSLQAEQALQALFANQSSLSQLASGATHTSGLFGSGKTGDLQTQIDALMPFLKAAGITFQQFEKIAADNGFTILDKEGRLVTDALQQMRDKLADVVKSLFTFQDTLSDQQSLSDIVAKLSGQVDTPQAQLNRDLNLIKTLAPNLLPAGASGQGGINQDALRKMLQDLIQRLAAGNVNPADFGGFQNLQELLSIINATADALNGLRDVTNGVTAALTNVPTGFKLALTEFDAQDAISRTFQKTKGPGFAVPVPGGVITVNIQAGAISIDPTNKTPAEIGQETVNNLGALAGQTLGNRTRWANLLPSSGK